MKVVFLEDVSGTAKIGDIKDVKPGFARNYLLPAPPRHGRHALRRQVGRAARRP